MNPTIQSIRVDALLSNVSIAYKNEDYVAEQILPIVPVKLRTGIYLTYGKGKFRKSQSLRAPGTEANSVDYKLTKSTAYVTKEHSLSQLVPDEFKGQANSPLNPEMDATENITEKLLVEKEYDLATYMQDTGNLTNNTTLSGTDQWSDYENSDPIKDIKTGKTAMHAKIFKDPNVLVLGKEVYDSLLDHPDIIDRIKYSQMGVATTELLARIFGVDKVVVAGAGYESANEGQTSSMSYIWGKYAWLIYVSKKPGPRSLSFGYHFQLKNRVVEKWYEKKVKSTYIRVTEDYTREIVTVDCAYLIKNAIA